jgi:LuxR family transcriptional regulator, maltose regulon positive regulatory protein
MGAVSGQVVSAYRNPQASALGRPRAHRDALRMAPPSAVQSSVRSRGGARRASPSYAPAEPQRPRSGGTLVSRPRLVERLSGAPAPPLALLLAPAGYGKTVLLTEWVARDRRPVAWLELSDVHNDPDALLRSIAASLGIPGVTSMSSLVSALSRDEGGSLLVIDRADAASSPGAMELLTELIERQPPGSQIALSSRTEPQLGLGSLRASRRLVELRAPELALTVAEATELFYAHALELEPGAVELLVHRTEGWPAALYLAALAAREEPRSVRALMRFAGDDRFVGDYIADELLAPLSAEQLSFLVRTSVLDRLSGPLCDHLLERAGSAQLLKTFSRMNLMLVPLDRCDSEYRYHGLFAQALRAELGRSDPRLLAALHGRAGDWYSAHGDIERAIEHAILAEDVSRAGDLLWSHSQALLGYGRMQQVDDWLEGFSEEQIGDCPALALTAAVSSLLAGDGALVEYWASRALRSADGREAAAHAGLLRAAVANKRMTGVGLQAEAACSDLPEDSGWRALGQLVHGAALHLTGQRQPARRALEDGARRAAAEFPGMQALCLAQLALIAIDEEDWHAAESLASRAKAQVERSATAGYATSALVYAVSADVQAHLGRVETSQGDARAATGLLAKLVDFAAWYQAECRIALARAAVRMSAPTEARTLLNEAAAQLERVPDAQTARGWIEDCRRQVARSTASSAGQEWCLTTAELRILQFLPTHLSLREIAERLYVSANTVKTHARSVYRKLGASSRGEAVVQARRAGLLDEASHTGVGMAEL